MIQKNQKNKHLSAIYEPLCFAVAGLKWFGLEVNYVLPRFVLY